MGSDQTDYVAIPIEDGSKTITATNPLDDDDDSVILLDVTPQCKNAIIGILIFGMTGFLLYIFIHYLETT